MATVQAFLQFAVVIALGLVCLLAYLRWKNLKAKEIDEKRVEEEARAQAEVARRASSEVPVADPHATVPAPSVQDVQPQSDTSAQTPPPPVQDSPTHDYGAKFPDGTILRLADYISANPDFTVNWPQSKRNCIGVVNSGGWTLVVGLRMSWKAYLDLQDPSSITEATRSAVHPDTMGEVDAYGVWAPMVGESLVVVAEETSTTAPSPTTVWRNPGELITSHIKKDCTTITSMADRLGVSRSMLTRTIQGTRRVDYEMAEKLATGIGYTSDYWMHLQVKADTEKMQPA